MTTTPSEEKLVQELFEMFDKDRSGSISVKELKTGLRAFGNNPTKSEIKQVMAEMGIKKGQTVSYDQFKKCMIGYIRNHKNNKSLAEQELQASFKVFDRDNNGTIDKHELKKVLTSLGEKMKDSEVEEMFNAADRNSDGKIEYKEFVSMFTGNMKS